MNALCPSSSAASPCTTSSALIYGLERGIGSPVTVAAASIDALRYAEVTSAAGVR